MRTGGAWCLTDKGRAGRGGGGGNAGLPPPPPVIGQRRRQLEATPTRTHAGVKRLDPAASLSHPRRRYRRLPRGWLSARERGEWLGRRNEKRASRLLVGRRQRWHRDAATCLSALQALLSQRLLLLGHSEDEAWRKTTPRLFQEKRKIENIHIATPRPERQIANLFGW